MEASIPFIQGYYPENPGPLARYLPPLPDGIAEAWLKEALPPGSWVLDPFGVSPRLAVEAARAGYRVLVASNNPVARFLLEMAARPPALSELRSALADLGASTKGTERIEPHIRSLYRTECANCGQEVIAEAFLWERGKPAPYGRIYHCRACGDDGEHPTTEADITRALHFANTSLHRARALERIAPGNDPDRPHAEEALEAYLPRAVYALFTIINKLESLPVTRRPYLTALLLVACDMANTLWPHPTARSRPRQLATPTRFRENNIWLALEESIYQWTPSEQIPSSEVILTHWPDQPPPEGGISLFEGRFKDLHIMGQVMISAVLSALPRPNQAYWTLSALWSGWLWGREASAPLKSVLRRRRYDWTWHSTAIHAAIRSLGSLLEPGTPFLGLIGETEQGFLLAALTAAAQSGFDLIELALRGESRQIQITWRLRKDETKATPLQTKPLNELNQQILKSIRTAGQNYLRKCGQPVDYLNLLSAVALNIFSGKEIAWPPDFAPAEMMGQLQDVFQLSFLYRSGFTRFGGSEHSLEIGQWWLSDESGDISIPLMDRVEIELVRYLQKHPGCSLNELDRALCEMFPGLFTPDIELVQACLDSYGEQVTPDSGLWQLRSPDAPKLRRTDLAIMYKLLYQIGQRLGLYVSGEGPIIWKNQDGSTRFAFYVLASAVFGKIIMNQSYPPGQTIIVTPGSRASLVSFKLRTNPRLRQITEKGWRIIKFRHLHRLAEDKNLNLETLTEKLMLDPLSRNDPQMELL